VSGARWGVKSWRALALALGFAAVSLALHRPGFGGPFISDDVLYLEHHPALSLPLHQALREVMTENRLGNWAPVHHLFLLAEWRLFADRPLPYRIVNALLHALVSLAVIATGRRAGLSRAAATGAGALFLVHPVAAEPVGWINQSKTLLSTGLALVALERWLAWLREPRGGRLAAALAAGSAALLAKVAVVTLPGVLLLAAWTHGQRGALRRAALDLLPLAVIGAIAFALGLVAQSTQGGVAPWFGGSPLATAQILPWLAWRYVRIVFAPFDLVHGVHPAPIDGWGDERLVWPLAALAAVALLVARACVARRERWLFAAWFAAMLLPVLQVVPMINLFADRYLYVALPGALWLVADVVDAAARRRGAAAQHTLFGVAALVAVLLAGYAHGRARKWGDPELLYREATIAYPQGRAGWTGYGAELQKRGDLDGAAAAYLGSLSVFRDDAQVRHLLGRVRLRQQRRSEALYDLEMSLRLAPQHHDAAWMRKTAERLRAQGVTPEPDEPGRPE
jgi:tetratricopeptide (TPR) repeat protein